MDNRKYLGDGVWVDFDGYQLCLYTDKGYIYINDEVYASLGRYVEELKDKNKTKED